jgi:hypothetical protein
MKKFLIKITLFVSLLCSIAIFWGENSNCVFASSANSTTYYSQLNNAEKKMYDAINDMYKNGILKNNEKKEITDFFTSSNFKDYQNGNKEILKIFAKARDAYYLDYPEIFYVNFDNISIGLYQKDSGFVAYINNGRTGNYLNGFESSQIDNAETTFNNKVNEYVTQINASTTTTLAENATDAKKNEYNKQVFVNKVKKAKELLSNNVTYSFESENSTTQLHIRTAYGALVNGKAVCEGFARAFKLLMDNVGIDCQIVLGYYKNGESYEPHSWNKVNYNGKWYLVDPTFSANDGATKKTAEERAVYELLGSNDTQNYIENNYVSSSDITFSSPTLATYGWGIDEITTTVETKKTTKEEATESQPEGTPYQIIKYSYNGKNAEELQEQDNLYVVARHQQTANSPWSSVYAIYKIFPSVFTFNETYYNIQFFVVKEAPDKENLYSQTLEDLTVIAESKVFYNEFFNIKSLVPIAKDITPNNWGRYDAEKPLDISIVYDMQLKQVEDTTISITPKIMQKNTSSGVIEAVAVSSYTKIENIKFDEKTNKVSFTFTPSLQYAHDACTYYFYIDGLVASENGVDPHPITFNFARKWVVCSKVYDGGRLYMSVYGEPVLIDNQDLSITNFKKEDGTYYSANQRSQMVLVASKATEKISGTMIDKAKEELQVENILSSSTYELDLHICGTVATIPEGSYMRLAFGFPDGYSKNDAGVTFKVYHYTKDSNGDITGIEEIPCVATEYGLVATVTSFSPYAVVAVKTSDLNISSENKTKNIYSCVLAGKGSVSATIGENTTNAIVQVGKNDKVTYTFLPGTNAKVDYVLFNQNKIEVTDNTLELSFDSLQDNNVLKVAFVDIDVANNESEMGLINLDSSFIQNEKKEFIEEVSNIFTKGLIIAMIVVFCCIGVVGYITTTKQRKMKLLYQEAQDNDDKNKIKKEKK